MLFGFLIYEGVEPIDLAALGVLSMARRVREDIAFAVVAPEAGVVSLANGVRVLADYGLADAPAFDVLIVAGGPGWVQQSQAPRTLAFLRERAASTLLVSICTGAMILAAAGVLDGRAATTKREVVPPEKRPLDALRAGHPAVQVREGVFVDSGAVITGGGVALCIDTVLYVLQRLYGEAVASEVARILEYQRARQVNLAQFPPIIMATEALKE